MSKAPVVNFLFEAGMLAQTPRSGWQFLGGEQSVAEHINWMMYIVYALASMQTEKVDLQKCLSMCLFHDFAEARTGDLNYVNQQYVHADETRALEDAVRDLPFGEDICALLIEYEVRETVEAQLVKDADNLEFLLSLKERFDAGNKVAALSQDRTRERLTTLAAKQLYDAIIETDSWSWWDQLSVSQHEARLARGGKKG